MVGPNIPTSLEDKNGIPLYLTADELARWLAVPIATLSYWRTTRQGPPFCRIGKHVRYRLSDVEAWLQDKRG
ncbi:helix-turn-helix domain-containing protein [Alphaproteobacteria bacterium LSUCC0719]